MAQESVLPQEHLELLARAADVDVKRHELESDLSKVFAEQDRLNAEMLRAGIARAEVMRW